MEEYKKMYAILCAAAPDALEALPFTAQTLTARCLLERGLREAEEMYLQWTSPQTDEE